MLKPSAKKICIVVYSLGGGGAERSSALLSQILYDIGYDVHIVSVLDHIDFPYKGKLLNLGEFKSKNDSIFGRIKRLKIFKEYLKEHKFDYIIDSRTRIGFLKEFILSKFIYNKNKLIYTVHSYKVENYLNASRFFGRLLYADSYKLVTVSKAIKETLENKYGLKNVETIYNAFDILCKAKIKAVDNVGRYILFFGRLDDDIKNITLLLNAYKASTLYAKCINLKILGSGKDEIKLKKLVSQMDLNDFVEFLPYQPNPYQIVKEAFFIVLTSRYEGFPMVLPESLALGVPVVSVDCKSGPNEIIINEHNGLLVENHNVEALANAMNRMIEDKDLYLHCKSNARASVEHLSKEAIGKQWQALLK